MTFSTLTSRSSTQVSVANHTPILVTSLKALGNPAVRRPKKNPASAVSPTVRGARSSCVQIPSSLWCVLVCTCVSSQFFLILAANVGTSTTPLSPESPLYPRSTGCASTAVPCAHCHCLSTQGLSQPGQARPECARKSIVVIHTIFLV